MTEKSSTKRIETTLARHGEDFFRRRARAGGLALLNKYGIEYLRKLASRGGEAYNVKYVSKGLNHGKV